MNSVVEARLQTLKPAPLFLLQVICVHDVSSIYKVPLLLEDQGVVGYFSRRLDMHIEGRPRKMLAKWKEMSNRWVMRSGA